jgi:Rrf2 family protein
MLITKKTHYALIALIDVCHHSGDPVSTAKIAERQNLPKAFLDQIFNVLKKSKIVQVQRGPGGGYTLSDKPENIRVEDIISAIGDFEISVEAVGSSPEAKRVNEYVRLLNDKVWNYFSISLRDLAEGKYD